MYKDLKKEYYPLNYVMQLIILITGALTAVIGKSRNEAKRD
jgi:hypothetical protein